MVKRQDAFLFIFIFILQIAFFSYVSIIYPVIPITYDEAWNYTNISSHGPLYSITNYPFANNHIFFTLMQSLTVPTQLLRYYPEAIRFFNLVIGITFISVLYVYVTIVLKRKNLVWYPLAGIIVFLVSPIVSLYFIVARGYLLGMVLLFAGIFTLSLRKYFIAALFFILSAWTVITYSYTFPLMYVSFLLLISPRDRKKLVISAVCICAGLFICYRPVLLSVLKQGNIWNPETFYGFLGGVVRSLSNFAAVDYGNILNGMYALGYAGSIFLILKTRISVQTKNFLVLLNLSIGSYLFTVGILSVFHIANPPPERAGMFIPVFVSITVISVAMLTRVRWIRYVLWSTVGINLLAGLYIFYMQTPFCHSNPFGIQCSAAIVPPVSDVERRLLKERKLTYIKVPDHQDDTLYLYFSKIYSVPIRMEKPATAVNKSAVIGKKTVRPYVSVIPGKEPSVFLLPTNPLYPVKRLWQNFLLYTISFFNISRKPRMEYLLSLSDTAYAEADLLGKQGRMDLAIKTLARGENYMTTIAGETGDLVGLEGYGRVVDLEILPSELMHQKIFLSMTKTGDTTYDNQLAAIFAFSNRNLQTILTYTSANIPLLPEKINP